jgi:hypothetical protein
MASRPRMGRLRRDSSIERRRHELLPPKPFMHGARLFESGNPHTSHSERHLDSGQLRPRFEYRRNAGQLHTAGCRFVLRHRAGHLLLGHQVGTHARSHLSPRHMQRGRVHEVELHPDSRSISSNADLPWNADSICDHRLARRAATRSKHHEARLHRIRAQRPGLRVLPSSFSTTDCPGGMRMGPRRPMWGYRLLRSTTSQASFRRESFRRARQSCLRGSSSRGSHRVNKCLYLRQVLHTG